jgi:hypothetical protein
MKITLELSDATYARLVATAKRRGKPVREMAKQLLLVALIEVES